jgi:anaerobic ribonucleoside-triphosphate reductase activating protein
MRLGMVVPETRVEGPGSRFALWVQGCPLRCSGCFNPQFFEPDGGDDYSVAELIGQLENQKNLTPEVEGVTLLGGEPLAQAKATASFLEEVRGLGLSSVLFTGYTLKHVESNGSKEARQAVALSDVVVAGPFLRNRLDSERPWLGSTNQTYHFMTNRYSIDDFQGTDGLELSISKNGELKLNGWAPIDDINKILFGGRT